MQSMIGFLGVSAPTFTRAASRHLSISPSQSPLLFKSHFHHQTLIFRRARMSTLADDTVMARVHQKIADALSPQSLSVQPTYGDPNGSHVSINVVSQAFEGKNVVKRHQLVYKAIWEELQVRCLSCLQVLEKEEKVF